MLASSRLSTAFLAAVRDEAAAAGDAASTGDEPTDRLEAKLAAALATARTAWPGIAIDDVALCQYLGARAPVPLDADEPLGTLAVSDLALAAACAAGDPAALAACDELICAEAAVAATAAGIHASARDEAIQVARTLLFLPRPERPPAIQDYAGRGPLRGWLRVMLSRELVRVARTTNRHVELEDQLAELPELGGDPVIDHLKTRYRVELADAFRTALDALPARERTLLRYQMVDGLSIDEIGTIHRVHRATAARWLVKLRDDLVERTRAVLAERLGIDAAEASSIVRLVQSQLDVSVIRHLR